MKKYIENNFFLLIEKIKAMKILKVWFDEEYMYVSLIPDMLSETHN